MVELMWKTGHEVYGKPQTQVSHSHPLEVHVVEVVLHELHRRVVVGGVELVRYVPAERAELAPLLNDGVQEGDTEEHGAPLRHVRDLEEVLRDVGVRALQTSLDALRRLVRVLDRHLQTGVVAT